MEALGWFKPLFAYPDEAYADRAAACAAVTDLEEMRAFAKSLEPLSLGQIQEAFIQAFDMNPNATLEIGWHLFGEQYERGEFLVSMRGWLRSAGVPEVGELPDHLLHVLPLVDRLDPAEAQPFADRFVLPALEKIAAGLPAGSIFGALVRGLAEQLRPAAAQGRPAAGPRKASTTEHTEDTEAAGVRPAHRRLAAPERERKCRNECDSDRAALIPALPLTPGSARRSRASATDAQLRDLRDLRGESFS